MANPVWPISLPQVPLRAGYTEGTRSGTIVSNIDSGNPISRNRNFSNPEPYAATLKMTTGQKLTFELFYRSTLKGGIKPFDWVNQRKGVTATFRIKVVGNIRPFGRHDLWAVPLRLAEQP